MQYKPEASVSRVAAPSRIHSLWFKILLCFVLPVFLLTFLWLLIFSAETAQKDTAELRQYRQAMDQQIMQTLESNANTLHLQSYSVYDETDVLLTIYRGPAEAGYFAARTRLQSALSNFMLLTDYFDGIALLDFDGNILFLLDRLHSAHNAGIDTDVPWYRAAVDEQTSPKKLIFMDDLLINRTVVAATCKNLYSPENRERIGILVCFSYLKNFAKSLNNSVMMDGEYVELYGEDGALLYSTQTGSQDSAQTHTGSTLRTQTHSPLYGWQLISCVPHSSFELKNFLKTSNIAVFLLIILSSLLISAVLSRQITKPLAQLNTSFQKVQTGNFDASVSIHGKDELAQIGQAYNHMLELLKVLTKERYALKLAKTKSELEALQAQINPHFLFNTLNSIKATCDNEQPETAAQMVQALSSLMRYTLSRGQYLVPFSEELQILKKYLYLQSCRFADRYTVSYDIEDDVMGLSIPRLCLQPLVENAIKHGLEPACTPGALIITAKVIAGQLMVYISNTGVPISQERLEQLNRQLQTVSDADSFLSSRIGLLNVCCRLKLHYAGKSDMAVSSSEKFTTVKLRLPAEAYVPEG